MDNKGYDTIVIDDMTKNITLDRNMTKSVIVNGDIFEIFFFLIL